MTAGEPWTVKKAVCVHEEDAGICWKHTEYRDGHAEVRRNRRLVLSFIATGAPPAALAYLSLGVRVEANNGFRISIRVKCQGHGRTQGM